VPAAVDVQCEIPDRDSHREDLFKVHSSAPKIGVEEVEREYEWPRATLVAAARLFEEVAFEGDEILHGGWSK